MTTSTITKVNQITVSFERHAEQDLECAQANWPYEDDEDLILLAQFFLELQEAYDVGGMSGFWKVVGTDFFPGLPEDQRERKSDYAWFMAQQKDADTRRRAQIAKGVKVGDAISSIGGPLLVVAFISPDGDFHATEDGRPYINYWHHETDGPTQDASVYYERFSASTGDRLSHGYADPVSRKIVQTG